MLPAKNQQICRACALSARVSMRSYATQTKIRSTPSGHFPRQIRTSPRVATSSDTIASSSTTASKAFNANMATTTANRRAAPPPAGVKSKAPKRLNPASPEYRKAYNEAARKWTAGLIAMPVFLVTSYYLFDRLILGNEKKEIPRPSAEKDERPDATTVT